jgi:hypothetical protein
MRFFLSFIFFLIFTSSSEAQSNLVLNSSFEEHDSCWPGIAGFDFANVINWSSPNHSTADFFSDYSYLGNYKCGYDTGFTTVPESVFGFEYAHNGECYGGFVFYDYGHSTTFYEYIQASFRDTLQFGKAYGLECYVSLGFEGQSLCISNLGFYFSDTALSISNSSQRINYITQYENPSSNSINIYKGWQRITGSFVASGGEKFMSIGMFKPYSMANVDTCNTYPDGISYTYLFIDDVAVYDTSKIDTISLCMNDSVQLGGSWQHTEGLYFDTIAGLPVKFYISLRPESASLTVVDKPFVLGDSVRLGAFWIKNDTIIEVPKHNIYGCDSLVRYLCRTNLSIGNSLSAQMQWSIYPNPANDFIEIQLSKNDLTSYDISIFDITGKEILTQSLQQNKIDVTTLNSGMYFVKLMNAKSTEVLGVKKFVKE